MKVTVLPAGACTSKVPALSAVTVWSAASVLVTVTVAPGETVSGPVNAKPAMVILPACADCDVPPDVPLDVVPGCRYLPGAVVEVVVDAGPGVVPPELPEPLEPELEQAVASARRSPPAPARNALRVVVVIANTTKTDGKWFNGCRENISGECDASAVPPVP